MRIILCKDYEEISKEAAKLVAGLMALKPDCVLGLATGSTPVGMYKNLAELNKKGEIDFSKVTTYNLDEYYPISPDNNQSYRYFMNVNLFDKVNIDKKNTYVPDGETKKPDEECKNYDKLIDSLGGADIQILGIGQNGHIGFNEPDKFLNADTHVTDLTESTIQANSRFFDKIENVPAQAITMGIRTILKAKKIVLLASGKNKQAIVKELLDSRITTENPATMLKLHPDVVLICDSEAYCVN